MPTRHLLTCLLLASSRLWASETGTSDDPYWRDPTVFSNRLGFSADYVMGNDDFLKGKVAVQTVLGEDQRWFFGAELPVSDVVGGAPGVADPKFVLGRLVDPEGLLRWGVGVEVTPDLGADRLSNGATEIGLAWGASYRVTPKSRLVVPVKYVGSFDRTVGGDRFGVLEANISWVHDLPSSSYGLIEWANSWNVADGGDWSTGFSVEVGTSWDVWSGYLALEIPLEPSTAPDAIAKTGFSRSF
jgi:hypothetical protein